MAIDRDFIAVTCINSDIDNVQADIECVLGKSKVHEFLPHNFKLPEQPYNSPIMAETIWEPANKPNSTMLMANFEDGWLTLVHNLGIKYRHELYRLRISDPESKWPVWSMIYYNNGEKLRTVQALKDGPQWEFFEKGEFLYFENPEYYRKRRIKDRFNKTILLEYLNKSGWNLQSEQMWKPKNIGYLIEYR